MISIVIPTYNRPDALNRTVGSILSKNISCKFEIIIVNDYPAVPLNSFPDTRVKIIENEKNLGRSRSRNSGAGSAKYPVLFFIDDDIEVKENLFDSYLTEYKNGYSAIFSNVKNVRTDGKYSFLNEFLNTRGANKTSSGTMVKSNYFTSAFCSVKKDFFDSIGGFDENFSGYGWEDPELGLRIAANDGQILYFKTENLIHYHDKNVFEWIDQLENSGKNLKYLIEKHPSFKKCIRYDLLTSVIGTLAFNPLFYAAEKLRAKHSKGFFGNINYSFLFYAAIRRSLVKIKKQD